MKFKFNNKYVRWGMTGFLAVAASIVFFYFMFHGSQIKEGFANVIDVLMPIVLGLVTAYLLAPVLNFVEQNILIPVYDKCRIKDSKKRKSAIRGTGILITCFLFIAVIYLLIFMLMSQIVPSVESIISNFDTYSNNVITWITKLLEDNPNLEEYVIKSIDQYSEQLENWLRQMVPDTLAFLKTVSLSIINVLGYLWDFIIGFIISIYLLSSKEIFAGQAKKIAYAFFERDTANIVIRNFRFTHQTFIGFFGGKIIDSLIIGILCFIGTSIMKTPYAALVSIIIGCTNVIPFFGPFLGAIPCTFLIFVVDPVHPLNCIYFAIFILLLQQFDGNILGPKILGDATGLSGFWVIFSITFFGGLYGVLGMIAGVPIFSVIYAAIRSIIHTRLESKNLVENTDNYIQVDYVDDSGNFFALPVRTIKEKKKEKHQFSLKATLLKEKTDKVVKSSGKEEESGE